MAIRDPSGKTWDSKTSDGLAAIYRTMMEKKIAEAQPNEAPDVSGGKGVRRCQQSVSRCQ